VDVIGRWSRLRRVLRPSAPQTPTLATVFIRNFIEIPRPMAEVEPELLESPGSWSAAAARDAEERGEKLLSEVGFGPPGARLG
jgi:hypothetical protein